MAGDSLARTLGRWQKRAGPRSSRHGGHAHSKVPTWGKACLPTRRGSQAGSVHLVPAGHGNAGVWLRKGGGEQPLWVPLQSLMAPVGFLATHGVPAVLGPPASSTWGPRVCCQELAGLRTGLVDAQRRPGHSLPTPELPEVGPGWLTQLQGPFTPTVLLGSAQGESWSCPLPTRGP